jgi:hypothetical protein
MPRAKSKTKSSLAARYSRQGHPSIEELQAEQGTKPVKDATELLGDFWPEEESIEDFLKFLHEVRGHDRRDRSE